MVTSLPWLLLDALRSTTALLSNPDTLTAWATLALAFVTVLLAVVTVFGEPLRDWLIGPRLMLEVGNESPYSLRVDYVNGAGNYEIRIGISNTGRRAARAVEVFLKEVRQRRQSGAYVPWPGLPPMSLWWADVASPITFLPLLSPGMQRFVGLGHIFRPVDRMAYRLRHEDCEWPDVAREATIISLHTEAKPNNMRHLLPPGVYQMVFQVAGANVAPVQSTIEVDLSGEWYEDESEMLSNGVTVTLVA